MRRSWADPKGDGTVAAKQRPSYALRSKRTRLPPRRHLQTTPWPTPGSNMHRPAWIRLPCNAWFRPSRMPSQGSTLTAMPCPASVSSPKYTGGFSPATPSLGCPGSCASQRNSVKRSYKAKQPSKSAPKRISSALLSSTTRLSAAWLHCTQTVFRNAIAICNGAHLQRLKAFDKKVLDLATSNSVRGRPQIWQELQAESCTPSSYAL